LISIRRERGLKARKIEKKETREVTRKEAGMEKKKKMI
jgi:hypothetical protein